MTWFVRHRLKSDTTAEPSVVELSTPSPGAAINAVCAELPEGARHHVRRAVLTKSALTIAQAALTD